jgi:hypothetical protein
VSEKIVMSDCRSCCRSTRHSISAEVDDRREDEFNDELHSWRVVCCLGCGTYSFQRKVEDFHDLEEDSFGNLAHSVVTNVYPSVVKDHHGLSYTYFLPPLIRTIYRQTISALSQSANVLASIGLRACIEAVCNHLDISGRDLQKRIDQLFKGGYVSNGDKRRLHAIRFLGNDAAHEIKEPKHIDIRIALEIVEHLLNTVFILEKRSEGLETLADSYPDFIKLLQSCAAQHKSGTSINLHGLLGQRRRLVPVSNMESYESQLVSDIGSGSVQFIRISPTLSLEDAKVHLYDVISEFFSPNVEYDDDLPF